MREGARGGVEGGSCPPAPPQFPYLARSARPGRSVRAEEPRGAAPPLRQPSRLLQQQVRRARGEDRRARQPGAATQGSPSGKAPGAAAAAALVTLEGCRGPCRGELLLLLAEGRAGAPCSCLASAWPMPRRAGRGARLPACLPAPPLLDAGGGGLRSRRRGRGGCETHPAAVAAAAAADYSTSGSFACKCHWRERKAAGAEEEEEEEGIDPEAKQENCQSGHTPGWQCRRKDGGGWVCVCISPAL